MATGNITIEQPRWSVDSLALVCGVANAGGGRIIITTDTKDRSSGFRRMRKPFEQVPAAIQRDMGLVCTTAPVMQEGHLCLEIDIPEASEPVASEGIYWLYTPEGNEARTREDILRVRHESEATAWEMRPLPFVKREDMHTNSVLAFGAIPLPNFAAPDEGLRDTLASRLEHIGLTRPHTRELTNAGAVMLAAHPPQFVPGASVRLMTFGDPLFPTGSCDELAGPLGQLLEDTLQLILERYQSDNSPFAANSRTAVPLPPEAALREALANALVHKDYESGVPVRVSLHPDRLVISNVGGLPEGWDMERLLSEHSPRPRNPTIAATAHLLQLVPGWGSGISQMISACHQAGFAAPSFQIDLDEVQVSFPFEPLGAEGQNGSKSSISSGGMGAEKGSAGVGRALDHIAGGPLQNRFVDHSIAAANRLDMTNTDEYVLRVLATNGRATAVRIAEVLGVSERTVRRSFKKLRDLGFIERIGSDKAGYWNLLE